MDAEFIVNNKNIGVGTYSTPVRVMIKDQSNQSIVVEENIQWAIKETPPFEIFA
jgi:hypothetical protein